MNTAKTIIGWNAIKARYGIASRELQQEAITVRKWQKEDCVFVIAMVLIGLAILLLG